MKWPEVPLSKVAVINPGRPRNLGIRDDQPVSFIPMPAVSEQTAAIEHPGTRLYVDVKKGFTYFEENDILFAKITPCMENGKSAIATGLVGGIGFGSTEFHVIRSNQALLLPKYVHYFVRQQSFRDNAKARMRGAVGQQRVPMAFLNDTIIRVPPIAEQRRIIEILDLADRLRKLRADADAKARRILPALFIKMFGDPTTNPKRFSVETLDEVTSIIHRYPTFYGVDYIPSGVPVVRISNICNNNVLNREIGDYVKVPKDFSDRFPLTILNSFDIVMAVRGDTTGKIGLVPPQLTGANISPNLIKISADPTKILPVYLFCFLLLGKTLIGQFINDTAKKSITAKNLKDLPVIVPKKEDQERFSRMIGLNFHNEQKQLQSLLHLERLFKVLTHCAFSGGLTAHWRDAHMHELLQEMERQSNCLETVK